MKQIEKTKIELFMLEKLENVIKFTNNTPFDIIIKYEPIPPKRKYIPVFFVKSYHFIILDQEIDLDKLIVVFKRSK